MSDLNPAVPEAEFLDPGDLSLERATDGRLRLRVRDREWLDVQLRLVFPLDENSRMAAVLDSDQQYLGTIEDLDRLDLRSRETADQELEQFYFRPVVTRIRSMRKRFGLVEMDLVTNAGPRLIRLRSPRDDIRELGTGRYLLTDAAGNRYEIPAVDALDEVSQRLFHNLV